MSDPNDDPNRKSTPEKPLDYAVLLQRVINTIQSVIQERWPGGAQIYVSYEKITDGDEIVMTLRIGEVPGEIV